MAYYLACLAVFFVAYLINTTIISVFYHRAWAHRAVTMKPWLERFLVVGGNWLTGIDPKGWVCMHRLHHAHSDEKADPHSPVQFGFFGLIFGQLKSYERILRGLAARDKKYTAVVSDLEFDISWLNRKRIWYLPYVLHFAIGLTLAAGFGWWLLGAGYFFGIMSHPVEGWMVNAFGHAVGGRNFDTPDNSRNNHLVAWLVQGEGFQNNHHQYPSSPKFSYRWYEVDPGWAVVWTLDKLGVVRIHHNKVLPKPSQVRRETADASA